jgi:hypothetical protein
LAIHNQVFEKGQLVTLGTASKTLMVDLTSCGENFSRGPAGTLVAGSSPIKTSVAVADLCRKHGVSSPTFYKWNAKFGGLDVSEAARLKALEDENAKLKRMLPTPCWTTWR